MNYTKTSNVKSAQNIHFLAAALSVLISLTPFDLIVAISSQRHSTVASGADKADCWDCTVAGFDDIRGNNLVDLMASGYSIQQAAIFSKDQNNFTTPIELFDTSSSPHLNSIGVFRVSGKSNVPPNSNADLSSTEINGFKPGRQTGLSSGFIFDSCLVLTNHHAVNLKRRTGELTALQAGGKGPQIKFSAGPTGDKTQPFGFTSMGQVVAHGDLQYSEEGDFTNDWAIVRLDTPVYNPSNPSDPRRKWKMDLEFQNFEDASGEYVNGASHYIPKKYYPQNSPKDSPKYIPGQRNCEILLEANGKQRGTWKTDCPSIGGASGSPLWTSRNTVVAITRGSLTSAETVNTMDPQGKDLSIAVPISAMFSEAELQRIKDKYGCDNKTSL